MNTIGKISTDIPTPSVTITAQPRGVDVFSIFEFELETMSESFSSLSLAFTGMAIGVALTLGVTLLTVDDLDPKIHGALAGCTLAAMILSLFFGWNALRDWIRAKNVAKNVRRRPTA